MSMIHPSSPRSWPSLRNSLGPRTEKPFFSPTISWLVRRRSRIAHGLDHLLDRSIILVRKASAHGLPVELEHHMPGRNSGSGFIRGLKDKPQILNHVFESKLRSVIVADEHGLLEFKK